jgi:hypothetical protein
VERLRVLTDVHAAVSSRLGISTEKIEALNDYAKSSLFSDAEKVALEYADSITDTRRDVDDELFARLQALRRRHHRRADDDHRVGERVLALQPGAAHPIARVLAAMNDQPHGLDHHSSLQAYRAILNKSYGDPFLASTR